MKKSPIFVQIRRVDKEIFLELALQHFKELNPNFVPIDNWKTDYFDSIQSNGNMFLCWIIVDKERVGFIIFGIENHRFLPRKYGMIYELYVVPECRRKGIGKACAIQVIEKLRTLNISRIQLEVVDGNHKAVDLWKQLGFKKVAERYVL